MSIVIDFNCDYCGKSGLIAYPSGVIYCPHCRMGGYDKLKEKQ